MYIDMVARVNVKRSFRLILDEYEVYTISSIESGYVWSIRWQQRHLVREMGVVSDRWRAIRLIQ